MTMSGSWNCIIVAPLREERSIAQAHISQGYTSVSLKSCVILRICRSAGVLTHKCADHAAAKPCGNCRSGGRPGAVKLAADHAQHLPSPSSQSGQGVLKHARYAFLHAIAFSNYRTQLQGAIL